MEKVPVNSSEIAQVVKKYSPYFSEAKKRLVSTLIVFGLSTILGFVFYEKTIELLINVLNLKGINIVFTSPFQYINLAVSCGIATGLIVAFPLLLIQILNFLRPALQKKEFRVVIGLLPFSILLFLTGFALGIGIMRWQIEIFIGRSTLLGINNVLDFSNLLSTILITAAVLGIGFQFPIVLLALMRYGIIEPKTLAKNRKWVYLGSFLFAVLLPADSLIADVVLALPLIILFELTFVINRMLGRRN